MKKNFERRANVQVQRCEWAVDPLNAIYHDQEWGVPVHDDKKLFEFLVLEGAQAGLSWLTVLRRRERYRESFAGFDPLKVSRFKEKDIAKLMKNDGLIRHRAKLESVVSNAQAFLKIQSEFGSFDKYIWQFVGGRPLILRRKRLSDIPGKTRESEMMSKDLKKRGFKFVGATICYAFMQACGLVSDHTDSCYRRERGNSSKKK